MFNKHVFQTAFNDCTLQGFGSGSKSELGSKQSRVRKKHRFETLGSQNVNYLNPSFHIKLPIFCIHGNHDDIMGPKLLSTLD